MKTPIAIKTHKRADVIQEKTLAFLSRCGISTEHVFLFVSTDDQAKLYARLPGFRGNIVLCAEPGVSGANNCLRRYFPKGSQVIQLDDDIEEMFKLDAGDKAGMSVDNDLAGLCERGFKLCEEHKTTLWGIYPVCNAFFMKPGHSVGLRFIWGSFNGFISEGKDFPGYQEKVKEDFECSIDIYKRYGSVIRFEDRCVKTKFLTKTGGTGSNPDNIKHHIEAAESLARRFPDLVKLRKKKSFGGVDIRLVEPSSPFEDTPDAEQEKAPRARPEKFDPDSTIVPLI